MDTVYSRLNCDLDDTNQNEHRKQKGNTHRVIFLPRFFTLPGGKLEIGNELFTYSTQRVLVQMPQYEILIENIVIYPGPIKIPTPKEASCLVVLDSCGDRNQSKVVKVSVVVPDGTTLRFWPPGSNDQIVKDEYELQATSKHAVRGEINGNHDHLMRNLYEMITSEQRKLFFRGKEIDLRKMAILKAALKAEEVKKYKREEFIINMPDFEDSDEESFLNPFLFFEQCDCRIL